MKKQLHPGVLIGALVAVVAVIVFLFMRATSTPAPLEADPLGNPAKDAALQKQDADGAGPPVTPDVQLMQKKQQEGPGAKP